MRLLVNSCVALGAFALVPFALLIFTLLIFLLFSRSEIDLKCVLQGCFLQPKGLPLQQFIVPDTLAQNYGVVKFSVALLGRYQSFKVQLDKLLKDSPLTQSVTLVQPRLNHV